MHSQIEKTNFLMGLKQSDLARIFAYLSPVYMANYY